MRNGRKVCKSDKRFQYPDNNLDSHQNPIITFWPIDNVP